MSTTHGFHGPSWGLVSSWWVVQPWLSSSSCGLLSSVERCRVGFLVREPRAKRCCDQDMLLFCSRNMGLMDYKWLKLMNTCQDEHLLNIYQYEDQTNRILMMVQQFSIDIFWNVNGIFIGYGWMDWFRKHNVGCFMVSSWNFNIRFSLVWGCLPTCFWFYSMVTPKISQNNRKKHVLYISQIFQQLPFFE